VSLIKRTAGVLLTLALTIAPLLAQQPPRQQNEFVPLDQLPPAEQLPSAPLLVGAYAFVWIATMFYLWTVWRRLGKVERDLEALERKTRSSAR
jgi:CcmD family protein